MKPVIKLVLVILPMFLLIACGDKAVKPEDEGAQGTDVSVPADSGGASTAGAAEGERLGDDMQATPEPVPEPVAEDTSKDLLSERKIYFDFDKAEIKQEFQEILQAHAEFLIANPDASVDIEGHCDERGTREYNIALGERRAHSVFQFLTLQGVGKNQVRTVSFGEERPDVEGHDESAWKWNRRAVFVYSE